VFLLFILPVRPLLLVVDKLIEEEIDSGALNESGLKGLGPGAEFG